MKNWLVLIILHITLSACTIDALVREGSHSPATSEAISIDFRANGEITDIYTSYDQTNYTLYQSIAGKMNGQSFYYNSYIDKGILKGEGFIVIEKTASSPASWANKSLWHVGSAPQTFEHYMDIPDYISGCKLYNHADLLNMLCYDSNHGKNLMYQVDKHTKTIQNTLDKWGYVEDSAYEYNVQLLWTTPESFSETIAVYKVLKENRNVSEIVDLYVFAGGDYQKVTIEPSDLSVLKNRWFFSEATQVNLGSKELVLIPIFNTDPEIGNLLVIDISAPKNPTLSRYNSRSGLAYVGVIDNTVIFTDGDIAGGDTEIKIYTADLGLQNTTIPSALYSYAKVHGNFLFLGANNNSFKKCSLDGVCTTLINDFSTSRTLSYRTSKKIYVIDSGAEETDRVINSIDVDTGTVVAETALTSLIRGQALTMDDIWGISENEDYLIVAGNLRYLLFDKEGTTIKEDLQLYCSDENAINATQIDKYLVPHFKGWNFVTKYGYCPAS